jgi:hypothetical protein
LQLKLPAGFYFCCCLCVVFFHWHWPLAWSAGACRVCLSASPSPRGSVCLSASPSPRGSSLIALTLHSHATSEITMSKIPWASQRGPFVVFHSMNAYCTLMPALRLRFSIFLLASRYICQQCNYMQI